jgi:prevent-host-death family protein
MVTVPARYLKNRTGEIVRTIERGETVLITKRGKPLAVMRPAKGVSRRVSRAQPDPIAAGVGMLAGYGTLADFLAEKRAEARREDRKWGIRRSTPRR